MPRHPSKRNSDQPDQPDQVAGNGLLDRRAILRGSAALAGAMGYTLAAPASADPLPIEPWMQVPGFFPRDAEGIPHLEYDQPSRFESHVVRRGVGSRDNVNVPEVGTVRTPHHLLTGTITPSGLHFTRLHTGIPDIDPARHKLLIHGLVKRPLIFTLETLARYPMESHIYFLECGGNSELMYDEHAAQVGVQRLHGQVSCSEWTGVRLAMLMEEAGVDPKGKWILAEGADASGMTRSVPMEKIMDNALLALYQNGERIRPSNGYPMRLFLPGFEGNMNVKYLRRIKVLEGPTMSRDETSKYTMTRKGGKSSQFNLVMEAKSMITQPSPDLKLKEPGLYQISGLAWSGYGRISKVEISADGGKSWAEALLQKPVRNLALARFHLPWRWDGGPALLQSRATDNTGYVQPTRTTMMTERGRWANYHGNCITTWNVLAGGEVKHVYA
jgi:sulfane dehydrogenase subunit SoxC